MLFVKADRQEPLAVMTLHDFALFLEDNLFAHDTEPRAEVLSLGEYGDDE